MKLLSVLISVFILSPIWPLGENPTVGAPYLIVNKKTNMLAYIDEGKVQMIYRVGTGKTADLTPEGEFTITVKAVNPYYRRKNIPGGAKENPLGTRWIGFDADGTNGRIYGIHGNNNPDTVGQYVSQGCVRMYDEEIQALFKKIPIGTKILITTSDKSFADLAREHGAIW